MTVLVDVQETVATVKSAFASKTNWTGALIAILGLLGTFGVVAPEQATALTALGGALVVAFRSFSKSVLKPAVKPTVS